MRALVLVLLLLACKDPQGFEPDEREKLDPPPAPALTHPADRELIMNYAYPQDQVLRWEPVPGALSYEVELYYDSSLSLKRLYAALDDVPGSQSVVSFRSHGTYFWRVRAESPNWKWYTDWSLVWRFTLPDPTD